MREKNMTTVQVLIATMNQNDNSFLHKMNLQTSAIVGNQCDRNEVYEEIWNGKKILWLNFAEKGVGLNRNNALMRSEADVILFADDDMVYRDGYEQKVIDLFNENPMADVIVFNIGEKKKTRKHNGKKHYTKKSGYGAVRIAAKRKCIIFNGITFNMCFGGGSLYSCGEDSLFLRDCVRKKLKILVVPEIIADLTEERESTWFEGYTDKYFFDQGVLLGAMGQRFILLRILKKCLKGRKMYNTSPFYLYKKYMDGVKFVRKKEYMGD